MVLSKVPFVKIYLYNILVNISDTPEEYLQATDQVFQHFREANLKLKVKKCVSLNQTYFI